MYAHGACNTEKSIHTTCADVDADTDADTRMRHRGRVGFVDQDVNQCGWVRNATKIKQI